MPRITFDGAEGPEAYDIPMSINTMRLRLTLAEARHIQQVADLTIDQVRDRVFGTTDPDPTALTALVQVLWKRQGIIVPFDLVDFDLGSFEFELLPEEAAAAEKAEAEAEQGAADAEDPTQTPNGEAPTEG